MQLSILRALESRIPRKLRLNSSPLLHFVFNTVILRHKLLVYRYQELSAQSSKARAVHTFPALISKERTVKESLRNTPFIFI